MLLACLRATTSRALASFRPSAPGYRAHHASTANSQASGMTCLVVFLRPSASLGVRSAILSTASVCNSSGSNPFALRWTPRSPAAVLALPPKTRRHYYPCTTRRPTRTRAHPRQPPALRSASSLLRSSSSRCFFFALSRICRSVLPSSQPHRRRSSNLPKLKLKMTLSRRNLFILSILVSSLALNVFLAKAVTSSTPSQPAISSHFS